jgi:hypothetical protein
MDLLNTEYNCSTVQALVTGRHMWGKRYSKIAFVLREAENVYSSQHLKTDFFYQNNFSHLSYFHIQESWKYVLTNPSKP